MRSVAPAVTEGPRSDILSCVQQNPGAHLRGIERMTELPLGQVLYHLDRLERMGILVSKKHAGFRRYYPAGSVGRDEKKYLAALRHECPRQILLALLEEGPMPHKWLQERLGVAGSTLSFHLQRLVETNVLDRDRVGSLHVYRIVEPELARRELIYYRESFHDERVDRYVRRALDALPPPPVSALRAAIGPEDS